MRQDNDMWQCPKCDTLNSGEICIICGEPKPEPVKRQPKKAAPTVSLTHDDTTPKYDDVTTSTLPTYDDTTLKYHDTTSAAPPPKHSLKTVCLGVLIGVIAGLVIVVAALEGTYRYSIHLMNEGNYDLSAGLLRVIKFYRNAEDMSYENTYKEAYDLFENGNLQDAKQLFEKISTYKDAGTLISECDYQTALEYLNNGELIPSCNLFEQLGGYNDSEAQLAAVKNTIYQTAIEYYRLKSYSEAAEYFEAAGDYSDSQKYLRLIDAASGKTDDVTKLYDLIGFENTNEIILNSSTYLWDYLLGYWTNASGDYIRYYEEADGSTRTSYNIPHTTGLYYKLSGGIHYNGSDTTSWDAQWKITILSADMINIYCYQNGKTYTLYRQ